MDIYQPKRWARPWMVWAVGYPWFFIANMLHIHRHTKEDVRDALWAVGFGRDVENPDD